MNDRTIGRAGFLGILGAGAAGLFFAKDFTGALRRVRCRSPSRRSCRRRAGASTPSPSSMPDIDPAAYRLASTASSTTPSSFSLADLKAMPRAEQVSDFHCVTGWSVSNVRWAGVRLGHVLERAGAARRAIGGSALRLGREAVRRLADAEAGAAPRRDARLRDGRRPDLPTSRRSGTPRDAGDVRLQERQVGRADRARAPRRSQASGSSTATTRTPGSGSSNGF